jgi:hypothetical protein
MTAESIFQEIRVALNGRPVRLVLGVCGPWLTHQAEVVIRLVTIVLGISGPPVLWPISDGLLLPETEPYHLLTRLGILARETAARWRR